MILCREASQEASLVTAQEEALEALTTLVAVTSHEPSEKNIPAIIQSMESLLDAVPAWVTSRPQRLCITTLNPILAASNTSSVSSSPSFLLVGEQSQLSWLSGVWQVLK